MIEVDLDAILYNLSRVRRRVGPKVKICAVVKGNAYGCGAVQVGAMLERSGQADMLAVALITEGEALRRAGIGLPILLMGDFRDGEAGLVLDAGLTPTVYRLPCALALDRCARTRARRLPVHLRVDVANGSPGVAPGQLAELIRQVERLPNLRLEGLYTQLYGAYEAEGSLAQQRERFAQIADGLPPALRARLTLHAASTPSVFQDTAAHYDMVRVGAALYGLPYAGEQECALRPAVSIRNHILSVRTVSGGCFAGYHGDGGPQRTRRLATISAGYEDTLFLLFAHGAQALVRGRRAPFVGEPCMDTATVDVTDIPLACAGDEAVVLGRQGAQEITIREVMASTGLSLANCQLAFKTGSRVRRKYAGGERLSDTLLTQLCAGSPAIRRALQGQGKGSLEAYVQRLAKRIAPVPEEAAAELGQVVADQLTPALGPDAARQAASNLTGGLLTANHHGVDYLAQSVQGNLLYACLLRAQGRAPRSVAVLACGGVPMDNSSYGRGLTLYGTLDGRSPLRLPLLPNGQNKALTGRAPAITRRQVEAGLEALAGGKGGRLAPAVRQAAQALLKRYYLDPAALAQPSYAHQASYINYHMTRQAFGVGFAYAPLEAVAGELLRRDLARPESLTFRILFAAPLRRRVLACLEGVPGCWNRRLLERGQRQGGGSMFLWGTDERYAAHPFVERNGALHGLGLERRLPYTPEAIQAALLEGSVFPSLFLCFTVLAFARGFSCLGGCFQAEYLTQMRDGLAQALREQGEASLAAQVERVETGLYLSGPLFLTALCGPERVAPAGIVEVLAAGGLTQAQWSAALRLPFADAQRLALFNQYPDVVAGDARPQDWAGRLSAELYAQGRFKPIEWTGGMGRCYSG